MHLHGEGSGYSLSSRKLLSQLLISRKFIGPAYALGLFCIFFFTGHIEAAGVVVALALFVPLLYGYAFITKQPASFYHVQAPRIVSMLFAMVIAIVVYLARDIDFIYLIAYPVAIGVYSTNSYRFRSTALLLSLTCIVASLVPVLSVYSVMVFLTTYILVFVFSHMFSIRIDSDNVTIKRLAVKDALTELKNRRALELDSSRKDIKEKTKGVIFLDVDFFKSMNDKYGHVFGDEVLKAVAKSICETIDVDDIAYRYGGEEFVVLTQGKDDCEATALNIREAIENITLENGVTFTASVGFARADDISDINILIKQSDDAMYHAKSEGRNRVVMFGSSMKTVSDTGE